MERRRKHVGIDPSTLKNVFVETEDDRIEIEQATESIDSTETVYDISIKEKPVDQTIPDIAAVEEDTSDEVCTDNTLNEEINTPYLEEAVEDASENLQEKTSEEAPEETTENVEENVSLCSECSELEEKARQLDSIKELLKSYRSILVVEEQTLNNKISNLPDTTESLLSKIQLSAKQTLILELLRDFNGKFLSIIEN